MAKYKCPFCGKETKVEGLAWFAGCSHWTGVYLGGFTKGEEWHIVLPLPEEPYEVLPKLPLFRPRPNGDY